MKHSPANGFGSLNSPVGAAIDLSGNLWVAGSGDNCITEFVGIAAPLSGPVVSNLAARHRLPMAGTAARK